MLFVAKQRVLSHTAQSVCCFLTICFPRSLDLTYMQNGAVVFFPVTKYQDECVSVPVQRALLQSYNGMPWIQLVNMDYEIQLMNGSRAVNWMRDPRRISEPPKAAWIALASLPL